MTGVFLDFLFLVLLGLLSGTVLGHVESFANRHFSRAGFKRRESTLEGREKALRLITGDEKKRGCYGRVSVNSGDTELYGYPM